MVSRPGLRYRRDIRPRARQGDLRILDVGAGGGDLCRSIARRLRRDGLAPDITALDVDERAIGWAAAHDDSAGVHYRCALAADLVAAGETFDIVISNHVLHHLSTDGLQRMLVDTSALVAPGGLASHYDIARGRLGYVLFAAATLPLAPTLLAGSFIRADGLTSIRRSYTARELAAIVPEGWRVRGGFPSRLEVRWESSDA